MIELVFDRFSPAPNPWHQCFF